MYDGALWCAPFGPRRIGTTPVGDCRLQRPRVIATGCQLGGVARLGILVGMKRIETDGSVWLIDEGAMRYCRFPKTEAGRELPEWGDERAGVLQDAVWHDMSRWLMTEESTFLIQMGDDMNDLWPFTEPARLIIHGADGRRLSAPNPVVMA